MKKTVIHRIYRFYYDGFREMTVGKTLWKIIGLKLLFFILIIIVFHIINK
jgi:hypothetical protein